MSLKFNVTHDSIIPINFKDIRCVALSHFSFQLPTLKFYINIHTQTLTHIASDNNNERHNNMVAVRWMARVNTFNVYLARREIISRKKSLTHKTFSCLQKKKKKKNNK